MTIDDELWKRIVALLPKLRLKKQKADKTKGKDLNKLSKRELIEIVKELTQ